MPKTIPARVCCHLTCSKPAEFEVWYGWKPSPEATSDACAEHLADLLDDSPRFEIVRLAATRAPGREDAE